MSHQRHPRHAAATTSRGALVLLLVCSLATLARAGGVAPAAVAVRTATAGAATRITIAANAPLAHSLSRPDERTLVVELPGVDTTQLAPSYRVGSPLVAAVKVERESQNSSASSSRLRVELRARARARTQFDDNSLTVELWPEAETAAAAKPDHTQGAASPAPQQQGGIRPSTSNTTTQQDQGRQYGEAGFVGEPINLNVVNADIRDILNYITEQYGVNFVIDKSVGAIPVTVNVTDVPWNIALDSILQANRLGIIANGNILRVATSEVIASEAAAQSRIQEARLQSSPLVTEFIRLNYARAAGSLASAAGASGGFAGGRASGETAVDSNSTTAVAGGGVISSQSSAGVGGAGDQGILPIIQRRLSRRGSVEVDSRSNTLIVTDVPQNIEAIRQLIMLLDQPEPQVEIETRIVIATRNFSRDLGVQLSAGVFGFDTIGGQRVINSLGNISTLPASTTGGGGGGGGTGTGIPTGPNPGSIFGGLSGTSQPAPSLGANAPNTVIGLTTGLFGTAQISALITAAEARGQAKIVATPRVTALNNRPAQIESGSQIPVVTPQTGGAGGGNTFTTTFISVPLRLSVTPQITDAGTVILRIVAENNSVNLSLTNALGTPGIDTQRMQSEVLVPDGGTTVVGGVLNDREADTQNRTPGLASVPVLGNLFKRKATTRNTDEILFFITPRIYRPDYQGRPTAGAVTTGTRTTTIPQPVPLGNPPTNTPASLTSPTGQPAAQPLLTTPPAAAQPAQSPAASPEVRP
ncbi:MAG TPA: type IV pilus secretin PilQ [Pyrinomonadaceae bacterium]|nr:type IV pilus secretin PilQ [Pyrinomonadaceae bacterium]